MSSKGSIQIEALVPAVPGGIFTSSPLGLIHAISGDNETCVITRYLAGEALSENNAVFINASGYIQRARANVSGTMPCTGIASIIPVSIALSGGVNVSGIFGSGISISAGSGSPVVVITRGIKDPIFVGISGSQNIATHGSIVSPTSGVNIIPVSGGIPNTAFYVSELSAGLLQVARPATGFIQRIGSVTYNSGQVIINPDNFYYNQSGFPQ